MTPIALSVLQTERCFRSCNLLRTGDRANIVFAPAEPAAADGALLDILAGVELVLASGRRLGVSGHQASSLSDFRCLARQRADVKSRVISMIRDIDCPITSIFRTVQRPSAIAAIATRGAKIANAELINTPAQICEHFGKPGPPIGFLQGPQSTVLILLL